MSDLYDVCVIGSGAGGGPIAYELAKAGKKVIVLEKGGYYDEKEFVRDEIAQCRRPNFYPRPGDEPQILDTNNPGVAGAGRPTGLFQNGYLVGGSSMLMSGFFLRLKPSDFRIASTHGPIQDADLADWPITYDDLEPWYDRVEKEVGVSGRLRPLPPTLTDKRSSPKLPLPPTKEHPFAQILDRVAPEAGVHSISLNRAVLPQDWNGRGACNYNGYCGSYACETGAKGGSLPAWIHRAVRTGNCVIRPRAMVRNLETDGTGRKVTAAKYFDRNGKLQTVQARTFVVACQAIESARLLLNSKSDKHPKGLSNRNGLVGRNLLFSTFGVGWGDFPFRDQGGRGGWLGAEETFVNRVVQDYYWFDGKNPKRNAGTMAPNRSMWTGGTLNFLLMHPNPIAKATGAAWQERPSGKAPLWGQPLKAELGRYFRDVQRLKVEYFGEWFPWKGSHVTLADTKDKWGLPVSRIKAVSHPWNRSIAQQVVGYGLEVLEKMGGTNIQPIPSMGGPSVNLQGGTCRFGEAPETSVLDVNCRAWETDNLYVTDGSFMPSGGRIPFTFTIYANALRVAEEIKKRS